MQQRQGQAKEEGRKEGRNSNKLLVSQGMAKVEREAVREKRIYDTQGEET